MVTLHGPGTQETATVEEVIAFLSQFPKEMGVVGAWEGQLEPVDLSQEVDYQRSGLVVPNQWNKFSQPVVALKVEG